MIEFAAILLAAGGYVCCFRRNMRSVRPEGMASWVAWFLLDVVVLVAMVMSRSIAPQTFVYTIGSLSIILLLYQRGAHTYWSHVDVICIACVVLSVVALLHTHDPLFAFTFANTGFIIGSIPIALSAFKRPDTESLLGWVLFLAGAVCGLLAQEQWDATKATCVLYVAQELMMVCIIACRRGRFHL